MGYYGTNRLVMSFQNALLAYVGTIDTNDLYDLLRITVLLGIAALGVKCYMVIALAWMPAASCNQCLKLKCTLPIKSF